MSSKQLKKRKEPSIHSEEDLSCLDEFCDALEIEDISYDQWNDHHQDLDLIVSCFVTPEEALIGGQQTIKYTKTEKVYVDGKLEETRRQTSISVNWPPGVNCGHCISFPKKGDQHFEETGELMVRIKVKT